MAMTLHKQVFAKKFNFDQGAPWRIKQCQFNAIADENVD
jgi:hypothetical protein